MSVNPTGLPEKETRALAWRSDRRSVTSLRIAVLALVVSIGAAFGPPAFDVVNRAVLVSRFAEAIISTSSLDVQKASSAVSPGSTADQYIQVVTNVWAAHEDSGVTPDAEPGTIEILGWFSVQLCFPTQPLLPYTCATFSDFEFSEAGRITRFVIDGQPLEDMFLAVNWDNDFTDDSDESDILRSLSAGTLLSADRSVKTVVFWIQRDRQNGEEFEQVALSRVVAQDPSESEVPIVSSAFPATLDWFETKYAAVHVPDDTRFLFVCWTAPSVVDGCDWFYYI
jgi:hypothetical protein